MPKSEMKMNFDVKNLQKVVSFVNEIKKLQGRLDTRGQRNDLIGLTCADIANDIKLIMEKFLDEE